MFDNQTPQDFSPEQPELQQAAQRELERRRATQDKQDDDSKGLIGDAAGIVGAIASTYATGNPLTGWSAGKKIGDAAAGRKGAQMPGLDQLQAVLSAPATDAAKAQTAQVTQQLGSYDPSAVQNAAQLAQRTAVPDLGSADFGSLLGAGGL